MAQYTSVNFDSAEDVDEPEVDRLISLERASVSTIRLGDLLAEVEALEDQMTQINVARNAIIDTIQEIVDSLALATVVPTKKVIS